MIKEKFLYYRTRHSFDLDLANGNIVSTHIAFIEDEGLIWTHNKFFGDNQTDDTYTKAEVDALLLSFSTLTINDVDQEIYRILGASTDASAALSELIQILENDETGVSNILTDINNLRNTVENDYLTKAEAEETYAHIGSSGMTEEERQMLEELYNDISDKVDAADLATVATTGSYNDLSNKPTILTINDIDSRVGAILNSSEDAVAALRELINELESTDGATVAGILSSLDAINQDVSGLNTRLDTAESNIQQIIDNQSTPTVNVPKHIIIEQGQYDENNYEQDAIYFILSSASTAWTFGGNFPISLT